jgi:hypothetical protein
VPEQPAVSLSNRTLAMAEMVSNGHPIWQPHGGDERLKMTSKIEELTI